MTIFVTWQLRVTVDSIRDSCEVFFSDKSICWWFQKRMHSAHPIWGRDQGSLISGADILQTTHDRPSGYHWICVILVVPLSSATIPNAYTAQTKTASPQSPIDLGCRDRQFGFFPIVFLCSYHIYETLLYRQIWPALGEVFYKDCEFHHSYFTKWKIYIIGDYRLRYRRLIDLTVQSPPPRCHYAAPTPRRHRISSSTLQIRIERSGKLELVTLLMNTWKSDTAFW